MNPSQLALRQIEMTLAGNVGAFPRPMGVRVLRKPLVEVPRVAYQIPREYAALYGG